MDETLIPTMNFRWLVPTYSALSTQPSSARLQQRFERPAGHPVWLDVPIVIDHEREG